jgi:hypothetical protein
MRLFRLKNLVFSADMQPAFPLLPNVERVDIECEDIGPLNWQDDVDHTQWLEFSRPYIRISLSDLLGLDGLIAPALPELTGVRVMEVLPALRSLFVTEDHESFFGEAADSLIHLFDLTFFL